VWKQLQGVERAAPSPGYPLPGWTGKGVDLDGRPPNRWPAEPVRCLSAVHCSGISRHGAGTSLSARISASVWAVRSVGSLLRYVSAKKTDGSSRVFGHAAEFN